MSAQPPRRVMERETVAELYVWKSHWVCLEAEMLVRVGVWIVSSEPWG